MTALRAFISLSRLKFLLGGFLGCALGVAVARWEHHLIDPGAYLAAQWLVTSLHLMTHYSNEYFDREADRLSVRTAFSGGSGVLVAGTLPPIVALRAAYVCAASGGVAALYFALHGNAVTALVGIAIGLLAWTYSAPPLRLLGRGLGEVTTSLVVGCLVPLAGYAAQTGRVDAAVLLATLPPGLAMFVMMLGVEVPDFVSDARSGKRNLLVRFGPRLFPALETLPAQSAARIAFAGVAGFFVTTLAVTLGYYFRT